MRDLLQVGADFSGVLVESEFGKQCVTCAGMFLVLKYGFQ